jgi:hypothetical protein
MERCTTKAKWLKAALETLGHPDPTSVCQACCCASEDASVASVAGHSSSSSSSSNSRKSKDTDEQLVHMVLWLEDRIIRLW